MSTVEEEKRTHQNDRPNVPVLRDKVLDNFLSSLRVSSETSALRSCGEPWGAWVPDLCPPVTAPPPPAANAWLAMSELSEAQGEMDKASAHAARATQVGADHPGIVILKEQL